ncbi:nucleotidyl transferase AbiEii/AbiGii toxin family protein [Methylomonas paludis]|uniref:Nucleotidyl transferase AbiEii/AbiGii toxin family protein n=1 Tax=Methylomonas paludis TaxID=1173101 RepID=A0A975RB18_9GAMM|nr:nucleotidyl transferase AbiEii/AbiGii toxin family protein [Methylomonas paludis]QWF71899.1 nucleotidyl transferase AbiEii/AbiGii toxin family protein [Methylomonas paludis]
MDKQYVETVRLLLDVAPTIFKSGNYAMKGGTAINLFIQDMPRLSVDIDAVVIDRKLDRVLALNLIRDSLTQSKYELENRGYNVNTSTTHSGDEVKLFIDNGNVGVKVEMNFIFRGTALPVTQKNLTEETQIFFSENILLPVLNTDELYGSKLVAAMDRQHPRDIFGRAKNAGQIWNDTAMH